MEKRIYKAAYIVIGDEILSGHTQEKNVVVLTDQLNKAGIRLSEVRIIGDDENIIITTIQTLSPLYDYVFTSGGIGPTHDDITVEAIAKAFDKKLERHPVIFARMQSFYAERKQKMTEARTKMTHFPEGAHVIEDDDLLVPGFSINNVYVMAGIPSIFQTMLKATLPLLKGGALIHNEMIRSHLHEGDIAEALGIIQKEFPSINIGSYPGMRGANGTPPEVKIILRGTEKKTVQKVALNIQKAFDDISKNLE